MLKIQRVSKTGQVFKTQCKFGNRNTSIGFEESEQK